MYFLLKWLDPLNTDTPLIQTLSMASSVSALWTGFDWDTITDIAYPRTDHNTILCRYLGTGSRPSVGRPLAYSYQCRTSDSCSIWSSGPVVSEPPFEGYLKRSCGNRKKTPREQEEGKPHAANFRQLAGYLATRFARRLLAGSWEPSFCCLVCY